ncbi:MAG: hypothetical protein JO113_02920 [Candidatus Eremiobacteraeota bacterium]|nr:hypothetical protein [Candidatus Eremiobacteraeota bacterium]
MASGRAGQDFDMATKHRYSKKEHRQVEHIKQSEEARGFSTEEAESIGYATVNKQNPGKHRYTAKEERQAEHIMESEEARGKSPAEAKRIGYATVNKQSR